VLTSLSEGLSITILESMSHGLPVVATRVGGNPELVQHGDTGLLTEPDDPADFSESVCRLIGAPEARRAMGTAGRRLVEDHFALDQVTDQYQRIYEELHRATGS
jgi:L-malate glycosyltransferase